MHKFIERITNQKVTLLQWLLGFSGILMVRFFLEALSSTTSSGIIASDAPTLVHYYLFFLAFILVFMLFLKYRVFKPEQASMVPKVAVVAFGSIFIAPLVDYVYTFVSGKSMTMTYVFDGVGGLAKDFFTFWGPNWHTGITLGIRVEVAIILLSIFLLSFLISKKILRSLASTLVLYLIIFIFLALPSVIAIGLGHGVSYNSIMGFFSRSIYSVTTLNNLHPTLNYVSTVRLLETGFNFIMSKILFLFSSALAILWFYKSDKALVKSIFGNSRPERVAHYVFMILLGVLLTGKGFGIFAELSWVDWLSLTVLCITFYFSWMFAVSINDIVDTGIDKITNPNRPLAENSVTEESMRTAGTLFLLASLVGGFLSGFYAFFCLLTFTALYYIYSAPPTRFKTIPFFSSFIIGLCCLSVLLSGFFTFSVSKSLSSMSPKVVVGIVVIFFLWSHIRDMKDIEGDRAEGVDTVPVLFGKRGPRVVGALSSLAYLLVPVFFGSWLTLPSLVAAVANYYFVVRTPYKEKFVFCIYGLFTLATIALYFLI